MSAAKLRLVKGALLHAPSPKKLATTSGRCGARCVAYPTEIVERRSDDGRRADDPVLDVDEVHRAPLPRARRRLAVLLRHHALQIAALGEISACLTCQTPRPGETSTLHRDRFRPIERWTGLDRSPGRFGDFSSTSPDALERGRAGKVHVTGPAMIRRYRLELEGHVEEPMELFEHARPTAVRRTEHEAAPPAPSSFRRGPCPRRRVVIRRPPVPRCEPRCLSAHARAAAAEAERASV